MAMERVSITVDGAEWERFAGAVLAADPDSNSSAAVRKFVRWFLRNPGAELPARPEPRA